jgi:Flp pilus assembly protein TadB
MFEATVLLGLATATGIAAYSWRSLRMRELAWQRLAETPGASPVAARSQTGMRRLGRPWLLVPWIVGLFAAAAASFLGGFSAPYVVAAGLMVGLLASQLESFLAAQSVAKLESQLAEAIDNMVGAVGAGAGVGTAIDAAITESKLPLRPYLEEIAGRIRLGDEPAEVFRSLAERVPLETFLLFTSALSVHWEVGGKLTSTLTTVGRTIRDRIDVSRRIRSNIAQSQFSTFAIVALTYFIAVIVWRNGPEQMADFVTSTAGSWIVAGSIILQGVGIVWMYLISKPRF